MVHPFPSEELPDAIKGDPELAALAEDLDVIASFAEVVDPAFRQILLNKLLAIMASFFWQ